MKIGILSDSHGDAHTTHLALELLKQHQAEHYLHCGDVGDQLVLDALAGLSCDFVWGNNDWDRQSLTHYARTLGLKCHGDEARLDLGGKKVAMIHGDTARLKRDLLAGQQFDYLLQGHTHVKHDERVGKTRLINPGALHRARQKTVALLDTATDDLKFFVVG